MKQLENMPNKRAMLGSFKVSKKQIEDIVGGLV